MARRTKNPFEFVAFDDETLKILAHGATVTDALVQADVLAPKSTIYVMDAGSLGRRIWEHHLDLSSAREILVKRGVATPSAWVMGRGAD